MINWKIDRNVLAGIMIGLAIAVAGIKTYSYFQNEEPVVYGSDNFVGYTEQVMVDIWSAFDGMPRTYKKIKAVIEGKQTKTEIIFWRTGIASGESVTSAFERVNRKCDHSDGKPHFFPSELIENSDWENLTHHTVSCVESKVSKKK